jgi:hypothetical protein
MPRPRFTPREKTPGTHCTGGWVGPRDGLDTEVKGCIRRYRSIILAGLSAALIFHGLILSVLSNASPVETTSLNNL